MASHHGRSCAYDNVAVRLFWYSIYKDVADFIKSCERCQKQGDLTLKVKNELHNVPVSSMVMMQIGVDLCNFPEIDEYRHLVVCIDYFSKWSKAKPIKDKNAPIVAHFLCEQICRHGCFSIQINDQGREFSTPYLKNFIDL